jgi:hypothetical protein
MLAYADTANPHSASPGAVMPKYSHAGGGSCSGINASTRARVLNGIVCRISSGAPT